MKDRDFLMWIMQRLHFMHHEPKNVDYMHKLASIIDRTHPDQCSPNIASDSDIRRILAGGDIKYGEKADLEPQG